MGEIVAAQSPFSGCIGDFRRLRQRVESGHYMGCPYRKLNPVGEQRRIG
jgi:hypothetical protein